MCEALKRSWSTHFITSVSASSGFKALTIKYTCRYQYEEETKGKKKKKKNANLPTNSLIETQYTT